MVEIRGLNIASPIGRLLNAPMRPGVVTWIGLRPARREPVVAVADAEFDPEDGLVGDHYHSRTNHARQVTLLQAEHMAAIAGYLGVDAIAPHQLRRNLIVSGINLHALKGQRFQVGSAVLLATGDCHPCSRMEETLGPGGYNAVRGHGGITARVVQAGRVSIGDPVARIASSGEAPGSK